MDGEPNKLEGEFEDALAQLHPNLTAYIGRIVVNDELRDDIVQDAIVKAIEKQESFRGDASLKTWVFTIARNMAFAHYRTEKRRDRLRGLFELGLEAGWGEWSDPEEIAALKERESILHEAIAGLTMQEQEIIALRDFEGLSGEETSQVLGISVSAVKSRLHRARLSLLTRVTERIADD